MNNQHGRYSEVDFINRDVHSWSSKFILIEIFSVSGDAMGSARCYGILQANLWKPSDLHSRKRSLSLSLLPSMFTVRRKLKL